MPDAELKSRLEQHLNDLPVLPQALVRLIGLDAGHEGFFDDLLAVVKSEPNYAARILILANSAAHAGRAPVTTLSAAIARIGSRGAANLVLALAVTKVFVPRDEWEISLWQHAVQVAVLARDLARIAEDGDCAPDEVYVCGLLHDVGRFVLFNEGPETLRKIDEGEWTDPAGLVEFEKSICGLTHSEIGALACERWRLPDDIRECVQMHHAVLDGEAATRAEKLTALVRAADAAMFYRRPGAADDTTDEFLRDRVLVHLPGSAELALPQLRECIASAREEAACITEVVGIG